MRASALVLGGAAAFVSFCAPDVGRGLIERFVAAPQRPALTQPPRDETVLEGDRTGPLRLKERGDPAEVEVFHPAERPVEATAPASSGAAPPPLAGPAAVDAARPVSVPVAPGPQASPSPEAASQVPVSPTPQQARPAPELSEPLVQPGSRAEDNAAAPEPAAIAGPQAPARSGIASGDVGAAAKTGLTGSESLPKPPVRRSSTRRSPKREKPHRTTEAAPEASLTPPREPPPPAPGGSEATPVQSGNALLRAIGDAAK